VFLIRRSLKIVAVMLGVLFGLLAVAAASVYAYGEAESNRVTSLPEPTGPYAVGRVSYHWTDSSREESLTEGEGDKRELMAFVWYPAKKTGPSSATAAYLPGKWGGERQKEYGNWSFATQRLGSVRTHAFEDAPVAGEGRYPVLVMEPGLGPLPTDYTTLAEDLASHGYIVVASAPTYSASLVVFPNGRVARSTALGSFPGDEDAPLTEAKIRKDEAAGARLVGVWAKDMSFELDQMERLDAERGSRFYGRLDTGRAGMFGHSLGGATALEACASDRRCRAAANLDGTPYGAGGLLRGGSPKPYMYVASEPPASQCDRECEEGDRWTREIYERSERGAYHLTLEGSRHFDFSDYAVLFSPVLRMRGVLGPIDGGRALNITNAYLLAFFDRYVKGEEEHLLRGPSPEYPEVRFEPRRG
jgi:predicted dienelactone hydrolase